MNDQTPQRDEPVTAWRLADNPIAIVGMSGLFPMARNFRDFWQNVVDAADCMSDVPPSRWNLDDYYDPDPTAPDKTYCRRGGFVPEMPFSVTEFGLPPNQLEVTTVVQLLSLVVARNVLADAGATGSPWYRPERTGVVLGVAGPTTLSHPLAARLSTPVLKEVVRSCGLTAADAEQIAAKYAAAFAPWEENSFPGLLGNVIAGRVANRLDLGGMNCTVDAACASSLSAVHMAISELVSGRADMMITGGCDTENSVFGYMCFSKVGALSRSGTIKPLDDGADGTLVGEGIGMLALKRLADAERDGDRVYAVIRGIGSSSDGRFKSIYAPRAEGQQAALRRAYVDADCSPASIGLFEAHATGTRVGDQTELTALNAVLRAETDETGYAAIGSVKSQIGHTKGAAGAASLMKLALALHHKVLPPTINVTTPNNALDDTSPLYVNTRTRPWIRDPHRPQRRAAASAMGFGGTNFHAVLQETTPGREQLRTMHRTARVHLWHAATTADLVSLLAAGAVPNGDNAFPAEHARVGFVARDEQEATALRELAVTELTRAADAEDWTHPKGVFFRRRAVAQLKVGALFAGQGSQYVDMGLAAVLNNPTVATAFDEANAVFADAPRPVAAVVFPPPVFDPQVRNAQETTLRRTEFAQPAIAALSVGQYRFLTERGLECAGFMGHSFGELTALWAAGSLDSRDFFTLAKARGAAMAIDAADADAGAMAAVQATREVVTEILGAHPEVNVCNHNAPEQVVVGGGTEVVAALVADCRERGLTVRELPVAGAFHTSYVAHAVEPFAAAVEQIDIREPEHPVYANSAGAQYGSDIAANRRVLTGQLLESVEFVRGLEAMRADGCNVFVEFGPKGTLTQFVRRTLGADVVAIATDAGPTGDSDMALKKAALHLAVLGAPIADVHRHDAEPFAEIAAAGMVVQLTGRDYVPDSRRKLYSAAINEPTVLEAVSSAVAEAAAMAAELAGSSAPAAVSEPVQSVAVAPAQHAVAVSANHVVAVSGRREAPTWPADREPETAYAGPGLDVVTQQHLAIHSRYTEGQLEVAEGLVSVLREAQQSGGADERLYATVQAIKEQSLAIGQTHTRVNEILASLTELEFGGGAATSAPVAPRPNGTNGLHTDLPVGNGNGNGHGAPVSPTALSESPAAPRVDAPVSRPEPAAPQRNSTPPAAPAATAPVNGSATAAPVDGATMLGADAVWSVLVEVVSEKTGYPPEMLALSMDLEADLGVDSIKRVQIMGALGERVDGVPVVGPEQVAELRTLHDIVGFVATAAGAPATGTATPSADAVWSVLVEVVSEKTGYPPEMLALSMDLEADLGVDSIKRVQIMGALGERVDGVPAVGPEQVAELRTLSDIVGFVAEATGAPAGAQATAAGADAVWSVLVEVVSEKTGYPPEMLALSMDLEADLGVDSIKRVQIMGALGERVDGVPAVGPEQVAELRTLSDIVGFVAGDAAPTTPAVAPIATGVAGGAPTVSGYAEPEPIRLADGVEPGADPVLLRIEPVRLPAVDRLDAPYAADRVALIVDHGDETAGVLAAGLARHGWTVHTATVAAVDSGVAGWDGAALTAALTAALEPAARLDLCLTVLPADGQWHAGGQRLADTLLTARQVHDRLSRTAAAGTRAAFVTVTRIDGALGHRGDRPAAAALVGGVGGLVKTLAQETPELFCRALDLAPELTGDALVDTVLNELDDVAVDAREVGIDADHGRRTLRLNPVETSGATTELTVTTEDVLVVTGGARGVTAWCVRELATRRPCEFLLLGRTDLDDEPAWAVGVADDALKSAAIAAVRAAGEQPTPRQIDRMARNQLAQREIRDTVAAVAATGARVRYLAVDITDPEATRQALAADAGRVTGIVHGAGALADALLPAKSVDDIRAVLATKLDGLHNVVAALPATPLRHIVLFGSVAGVYGNPGQADYAVANEALNRAALSWRRHGFAEHVTAVNWGAWDGGMVTPELREVFLARGVALLGKDAGARMFAEQFTTGRAGDVSVLIGPAAPLAAAARPVTAAAYAAHRDPLALATDPVILDHRVGQFPVFPAAAGLGWAINVLERANPGLRVVECSGFEVLKGIVYDGSATARDCRLEVTAGEVTGDRLTVKARISGIEPGKTIAPAHFAGTFVLAPESPAAPVVSGWPGYRIGEGPENGLDVYHHAHLFHGPLLQGVRRILERSDRRSVVECTLADTPIGAGNYAGALHSPVLADVVVQAGALLGVWFMNSGCLPLAIGRIEYFAALPDAEPFVVIVDDLRTDPTGTAVTVTATACDPAGRVLQRYTDLFVVATPEMTEKFAEAVRLREQR
ncbi:type I polyketide synthase [Nocardia sp. alder85J]|uniref:type I polyketide synthase n=1 Tax=Nocardia sp. alder85J TaxID=2862949 RepID=UPI001CD28002|nr:type I polyketide synthase [Nocardia sp. alder85J]MCX4091552.1 type I polyketide synthase [Nocardia sp. alder85J]